METQATSSGGSAQPSESTSLSDLFRDSTTNEPLSFHLHSTLPPKLKAELAQLIKSHGGKIHKRLIDVHHPFYALINPSCSQVPQYSAYVSSRPEGQRGTVVPYSFVRASIMAREILRPIDFKAESPSGHEERDVPWTPLALTRGLRRQDAGGGQASKANSTGDQTTAEDDGWGGLEPVAVYLHPSIGRGERRMLAMSIAKAGGDPESTPGDAQVVLVDKEHAEFSRQRKQYEHSLRTYVEPVTWVARCIAKGRYFHDPIEKAPMSGRKPGADRNDFTTEDDNNLARFIAKRIPDKSDGGRTGNNLYKDLCDRTDIYPWAAGHTWQSWRNRYRKKQDYFDPIIDKYVMTRQGNGDGKGEFQYTRGKKRAAPTESLQAYSSRSPSILSSVDPEEEGSMSSQTKKRRSHNPGIPVITRNSPGSQVNQRNAVPSAPGNSSLQPPGTGSSCSRTSLSVASTQPGTSPRAGVESRSTSYCDPGDRSLRQNEASRPRQGDQSNNDSATRVASRMKITTEVTTPTTGANADPLQSNPASEGAQLAVSDMFGYASDNEIHAKAKDLGLSDYLESGFTSTW